MDKKITIVGSGKVSVSPDLIVISLTVTEQDMDYNVAYEKHCIKANNLVNALIGIKFKKNDIKTSSYTVDSVYRDKRNKDGDYDRVFGGYRVKQDLEFKFNLNFKKLENVINAIMAIESNPNCNIRFTCKDSAGAKHKLLANATADAIAKADVLCESLGVKRGEIISVSYGFNDDMDFESRTSYARNGLLMCENRCPSPHFVTDDIVVEDSVTFVWKISE